jgi:hypothetical protein
LELALHLPLVQLEQDTRNQKSGLPEREQLQNDLRHLVSW